MLCLFIGCASSQNGGDNNADSDNEPPSSPHYRTLDNGFGVVPQQPSPSYIKSIQLYKSGNQRNAPIIELKSGETLSLEFDYLETDARQFKVQISHRTPAWKESILTRNFYQQGFFEDQISDYYMSRSQHPAYQHYTYEFPNDDIQLKVSGNYLLSISDYESGRTLFSLPFFVYENEGQLQTSIQNIPAPPKSIRRYHQLFGEYFYPDFVSMPKFDLSFYFVQNEFWGRYKKAGVVHSQQKRMDFHVTRDEAFIADYGFKFLDLTELSQDGINIRDYQPGHQPPHIILRRDIQDLSPSTDANRTTRHGFPIDDREARYANVFFYLETAIDIRSRDEIYVTGDFNNWMINEQNRLTYDPDENAWVGNALIKQGQYSYKYVIVRNGTIQDMLLDNSYSLSRQKYFGLVYYEDQDMNYQRLLQIQSFQSD